MAAGALGDREGAADRADLAGQRELADDRAAGHRVDRQLGRGGEYGEREREVEGGAHLAQVGRREVDRDPLERELEPGVDDRRADALASLADRLVREAHDRERGQAQPDVGLDPDAAGLDPVERERDDSSEGHQNAASRWSSRTSSPRASSRTPTASNRS